MPRLFERYDGTRIEMLTPEELVERDASAARSETARLARVASEPAWLAGIPAFKARVIVEALAEATYSEPQIASKVFEVCRRFGLHPAGSWPDSK